MPPKSVARDRVSATLQSDVLIPRSSEMGDGRMIPKTIHYCWFGNSAQSELNKRCIASWRRLMPEYQIKEWNETNSPLDNLYSQTALAKRLWSKLSNLVRLQALYNEGGIYLDTDVEVIKNFSPLLHDECFVGFQQEEDLAGDWVNNAVMGAQQGHPFLKRCVDLTEQAFEEEGELLLSPVITTMILKAMGLRKYKLQKIKDVTLYPIEYFYPYPWFGQFTPDCIKENTYCVHHWEGTWRKKEHAKILRPLRIMKKIARSLISKPQ